MAYPTLPGPAGRLHYDDGGQGGTPVVFLHSFSGTAAHWATQLAHLRPYRRAVALDFRGHGRSGRPKSAAQLTIDELVNDVTAAVEGLTLPDFVLVGHSLGAAVAIDYAAKHPGKVAGLLLVGPPGKVPEEHASEILAALEADYEGTMRPYWDRLMNNSIPKVRRVLIREMQTLPKEIGLPLIKASFGFDPVPPLRTYPGPKMAVLSDVNDQPTDLHRIAAGLPHKRISGTSHWPHMDKPEAFNAILDEFLKSIDATMPMEEPRRRAG